MSLSSIEDKILVCLLRNKIVKIIDYNLKEEKLEIIENSINDTLNIYGHFYKCIQIRKNNYLTSEYYYIKLWYNKLGNFLITKKIGINSGAMDLLLINNEYFISSHPSTKTLLIFDLNNYKQEKIISYIDCINSPKSLFNIREKYILVSCFKGIGLILVKTKELIQYFELDYNKIYCDESNNIYILSEEEGNSKNRNCVFYNINIMNIFENEFKIKNKYQELKCNEDIVDLNCLSNNVILIGNFKVYLCQSRINK